MKRSTPHAPHTQTAWRALCRWMLRQYARGDIACCVALAQRHGWCAGPRFVLKRSSPKCMQRLLPSRSLSLPLVCVCLGDLFGMRCLGSSKLLCQFMQTSFDRKLRLPLRAGGPPQCPAHARTLQLLLPSSIKFELNAGTESPYALPPPAVFSAKKSSGSNLSARFRERDGTSSVLSSTDSHCCTAVERPPPSADHLPSESQHLT